MGTQTQVDTIGLILRAALSVFMLLTLVTSVILVNAIFSETNRRAVEVNDTQTWTLYPKAEEPTTTLPG